VVTSLTEDPPEDTINSLEGILSLGKARKYVLSFGPEQKLNIDPWL